MQVSYGLDVVRNKAYASYSQSITCNGDPTELEVAHNKSFVVLAPTLAVREGQSNPSVRCVNVHTSRCLHNNPILSVLLLNVIVSTREVENAARLKKRTASLHESQMKRAKTLITEATCESAAQVLQHPDVVDIVCGPLESKLCQLQRQLADEKALHRQTQRCVHVIGLLYALAHALIMIWLSSRELRKRDSQLKERKQKLMHYESEVKRLELKYSGRRTSIRA